MARPEFAASILRPLQPVSILDIGCRDASLADELSRVEYAGADLFPDSRGRVKYVGDVTSIEFDRTFDAIVALDILEHLDKPSVFFDQIVKLAERVMLVSLPNTYDLKSRAKFAFCGQLGGKYQFVENAPVDRHRWLMNYSEIVAFYEAKADKHSLSLEKFDLVYGDSGLGSVRARLGRGLASLLPPSLTAATVFGLFRKE